MCSIDRETFEYLNNSFIYILNQLDKFIETTNSIVSSIKGSDFDSDKNNEQVKKEDANIDENDGEKSIVRDLESISGKHDQKRIDQKATERIKNRHRFRKTTSFQASLCLLTKFASRFYSLRLKNEPRRVFRRKKKYK